MCPYYLDGDQTGQVRTARPGDTHIHQLIDVANYAVFKVRRGAPPPVMPAGGLSKLNSACASCSFERVAFRPSSVDMLGGPGSASGRAGAAL